MIRKGAGRWFASFFSKPKNTMLEALMQRGFLRTTQYKGVLYYTLAPGCTIRITKRVLAVMQENYRNDKEIGGVLGLLPLKIRSEIIFVCDTVFVIPNGQPVEKQANSYLFDPKTFNFCINEIVKNGMLPVKFHSHPTTTGNRNYDNRLVDFFSKTSITDRHSSYIPYRVGRELLITPDGLLAPENREGTETRLYLYNGFITPLSLRALVVKERNFLLISGFILMLLYFSGRKKMSAYAAGLAAVAGVFLFLKEAALRPKISKNQSGDLIISIPKI